MGSIGKSGIFSGSSSFSSSFDQVLQRAVGIASLPLHQMQNNVAGFQNQQAALFSLQSTFGSLQSALQGVATAAKGNMMANVSNGAVVSASASSTALPGTYTIEVDELGSSTNTISSAGGTPVDDPASESISSSTAFTLTINGTDHTINIADHSLTSLAGAINSAGLGVQATIVNLGSTSSPDYRLAVASTNLGADTIQLNDGSSDLLTTLSTGADAEYKVNGNPTVIHSQSSQVTLALGLTVNLLSAAPSQTVKITVTNNSGALSNALSQFATAYNSTVDAVGQNRGQNGGALTGHSIISSMGQILSQMTQYGGGSGSVKSMTNLGLNLDSNGHLTFDATQFGKQDVYGVQQFLGGLTTGGFLQTSANSLKGLLDASSGALTGEVKTVEAQIQRESHRITDEQDRIALLQANLHARLTAADAAIAILQQQKTIVADMFAAQYLGKNTSDAGGTIG